PWERPVKPVTTTSARQSQWSKNFVKFLIGAQANRLRCVKAKAWNTKRRKPERKSCNNENRKGPYAYTKFFSYRYSLSLVPTSRFRRFCPRSGNFKETSHYGEQQRHCCKGFGQGGKKDFPEIQVKVKGIMENMDQLVALFPKGSISEKSRAKAEIWEKWDEFSKLPGIVNKAAQALADAAKAKDETEVDVKLKALGDACNVCHRGFRAPRKSS
ncbi:MAG: cytochrome c prime, partial [Deltaproteobacteria bacterium]|nr:cytochrome c prime [Deltaproteobacteria bacterium]